MSEESTWQYRPEEQAWRGRPEHRDFRVRGYFSDVYHLPPRRRRTRYVRPRVVSYWKNRNVPLDRIALQLYTVRDETARDFAGTLRRVAEIGYSGVEFAGYGGLAAHEMAALLKETGLKAASTHVSLSAIENNLDAEIAYCHEIGCSFLVLPWLPPDMRDMEAFKQLKPRLSEWGKRCHEQGITFCYHNHDFEFTRDAVFLFEDVAGRNFRPTGPYPLDYLFDVDATDYYSVKMELDVFWAAYAGIDVGSYIITYPKRIPLIHLKDTNITPQRTYIKIRDTESKEIMVGRCGRVGRKDYVPDVGPIKGSGYIFKEKIVEVRENNPFTLPEPTFTEVLDGKLNLDRICRVARENGAQWFIVENDSPQIPSLESARRSFENLRLIAEDIPTKFHTGLRIGRFY